MIEQMSDEVKEAIRLADGVIHDDGTLSFADFNTFIAAASAVGQAWKRPHCPELLKFINETPLVQSLLYDVNLLPEQVDNARHWSYTVAICEHMREALSVAKDPQSGNQAGNSRDPWSGAHSISYK